MRAGILLIALMIGCGDGASIVGGARAHSALPGSGAALTPNATMGRGGPFYASREIPPPGDHPALNAFTPAPAVITEAAPPADPVSMWPTQTVWSEYWFPIESATREGMAEVRDLDALVAIEPGMRVADVGAGGGFFTFRYASRVGPTGEVLAVDIDRRMSLKVAWEASARGLSNVTSRWVPRGELALEADHFDRVLVIDIGAFMTCKSSEAASYLDQSAEALRPGGRLVIQQGFNYPIEREGCASMSVEEIVAAAGERFTLTERRTYRDVGQSRPRLETIVLTRR